jgi:hypothetical protein
MPREKKESYSFSTKPSVIDIADELADNSGVSRSALIEYLIMKEKYPRTTNANFVTKPKIK